MEFDESLPANIAYEEEDFYKEFGACFVRNSLFSEKKPVPNLGDNTTPINKVLKFYEFWTAFKSWRDFTMEDEYDLDQAENRYERRYMDKENKRMKKDLLKKEKNRINRLVEMAKKKDPRIIKHEKEESEKIEKIREEKKMEKVKKREEEERRKQDALDQIKQKEQREQDELKRKENEVKALRLNKRKRLDDLKEMVSKKVDLPEYGPFFIDFFFEGVNEEEFGVVLELLNEDYEKETMRTNFKGFISSVKERQNPQYVKKDTSPLKEKKFANVKKWTDEEVAILTKGMLKYPAGMGGRWEKIADLIGGSKTIHEVTAMAKDLSIKNVRGEKNIINTMEEVLKEKKAVESSTINEKSEVKPAGTTPVPNPLEWSQNQQKQLELAMKQFPASMDKKERWTKISESIPGKTPKECIERVKEIREKLAKKP